MPSSAHEPFVDRWLADRVGDPVVTERVAWSILSALHTIWIRSRASLGEVTLQPIVRRVLETARREHPAVAHLELPRAPATAAQMAALVAAVPAGDELLRAAREVLVELLRVLGGLTGEALTPGLYEELAAARMTEDAIPEIGESEVETRERPVASTDGATQ